MQDDFAQSFDAQKWAKAFMERFGENRGEIDEAVMIGWFANAIMRGYDEAQSQAKKTA